MSGALAADVLEKYEGDLASLACRAASEIDDLIIGQTPTFVAVKRLSEILSKLTGTSSPSSLVDPTTAVILNRAIGSANLQVSKRSVDELLQETKRVTRILDGLAGEPDRFRTERITELKDLLTICLSLSRQASAFRRSPDVLRPTNPFRR